MKADAYLPVEVRGLPAEFCFQSDGKLRDKIRHAVTIGVVRVIAGPLVCDVVIDIARPYYKAIWTDPI